MIAAVHAQLAVLDARPDAGPDAEITDVAGAPVDAAIWLGLPDGRSARLCGGG